MLAVNACEFSHSYVSHRIFLCVRGSICLYWSQVNASNFCFVYYPSYEGSTEKNLQWLPIFWYPTVSLFLCSLSWVWWFFLLLMDYFDKLLLTAPLKNYRNMFSLSYLFHNICLTVNFYLTQLYTGSDLWSMGHRLNWVCIVHLYN